MKNLILNSKYPQLWIRETLFRTYLIISYPDGKLDIESDIHPGGYWETSRESAYAWRKDASEASSFTFLGDIE